MAGVRWPPEESELLPPRQLTTADLISDDDRSVAADSWSIKSEYGSTVDDEQRHVDAAEVLAGGNFPATAAFDYSSDKDELDASEVEASMLGFQSYWDASYAADLANFHEHGHAGEIWFGVEVMNTVATWTKNLCANMPQGWNAADDSNFKTESCEASKDLSSWRVLDIGTGNGLLLQELAKKGFSDLMGTDYSEGAIDLARNLAIRDGFPHINFLVDDVLETKLDKKFNVVMDKGTLDAIGLHPDGPVKRSLHLVTTQKMSCCKRWKSSTKEGIPCRTWTKGREASLLFSITLIMSGHILPSCLVVWQVLVCARLHFFEIEF
uniref:EEF1A lysine methyltransferase 2 isoform X2 n=1 Tax=Elaeis guineensis var. tenera TaxID=51953 RepID=A0A6I9RBR8_ELAGV|nr:EEF1A lysine methyltransferase 2 isoform X2 [Elaeis guineensis]